VKLALELGGDANQPADTGDTALHFAASKRFNSVVEYLVARGANVNVKNKRGATPLALATTADRRIAEDAVGPRGTAEVLKRLGAK
jgi:ankyrin repeat protein